MYETLKQAGYEHIKTLGNGEHLLKNIDTNKFEVWFANKNHASYGLIYNNTHLEFAREQKQQSYCGINDCQLCKA